MTERTEGHKVRWTLIVLLACVTGGLLLFLVLASRRRPAPASTAVRDVQPDATSRARPLSTPERPAERDASMVEDLRSELARKPRAELFRRAKDRSIPGTLTMSKEELVDALLATGT